MLYIPALPGLSCLMLIMYNQVAFAHTFANYKALRLSSKYDAGASVVSRTLQG